MADYIELPLIDDPDALLELGVEYLEDAVPGLQARPGNPETVLLEANSQIAAEVVAQAAQVPPIAFAYAGQSLYGIALREAVPATAVATISFAVDVSALTVAAESMLAVPHPSGEPIIVTTDADLIAPAGGGDLAVNVTALDAGAAANGARGASELIEVIDGVEAIDVTELVGGVDEESDEDYLNRLADALTLLAPRPILPGDFAVLARQVEGVGRATALDLYQPGVNDGPPGPVGTPLASNPNGATNQPRCVTVAITDEAGQAPTLALMQQVWAELDARREVNFLEFVIAPHYVTIDVRATVKAYPGRTLADVQQAVEAVIAAWLDPANFGAPTTEATDWIADDRVRWSEAIDYLNRADGVAYVVSAEIRKSGGAYGTTDVLIGGVVGLPRAGIIEITVQAP